MNDLDNPEWLGLLAAIRAAPDDYLPRLVAADWLEEHGAPERAEFIRVQCHSPREFLEFTNIPHRTADRGAGQFIERWVLTPGRTAFRGCLGVLPADLPKPTAGVRQDVRFRRGFVDEVWCPAAVWWGGTCERCDGRRDWHDALTGDGRCLDCHGTGRTEGIGRRVVKAHPVTAVVLTDREPTEAAAGGWFWNWTQNAAIAAERRNIIPREVFVRLGRPDGLYTTSSQATSALSAAALAWANGDTPPAEYPAADFAPLFPG